MLVAVARGLWPMTTLMLRSWYLLVAVAPDLWPMIALRTQGLVALQSLVAPGSALPMAFRLHRRRRRQDSLGG